jgi:hypothetical protein
VTILTAHHAALVDGIEQPTPELLASLHEEALRLVRVIEDLEALAAAEAAGLRLEREPVDLADVAGHAVELLAPFKFTPSGGRIDITLGTGETLTGTPTADVVSGRGGNDTIYGRARADRLYGRRGADAIYGGAGNESNLRRHRNRRPVRRPRLRQRLRRRRQGPHPRTRRHPDIVSCGRGNDTGTSTTSTTSTTTSPTTIDGTDGDDALHGPDDDAITGGPGTDLVYVGAGNDTIAVRDGEIVSCGVGTDTVVADLVDRVTRGDCETVKLPALDSRSRPDEQQQGSSAVRRP